MAATSRLILSSLITKMLAAVSQLRRCKAALAAERMTSKSTITAALPTPTTTIAGTDTALYQNHHKSRTQIIPAAARTSPLLAVMCLALIALRYARATVRSKRLSLIRHPRVSNNSTYSSNFVTYVPNLQLSLRLVQAPGAAEAGMENHVATTLVPPVILTQLPWKLSVASAAPYWPSDNNLAASFNSVHPLRRSATQSKGRFSLCHILLSILAALLVERVLLLQRHGLG